MAAANTKSQSGIAFKSTIDPLSSFTVFSLTATYQISRVISMKQLSQQVRVALLRTSSILVSSFRTAAATAIRNLSTSVNNAVIHFRKLFQLCMRKLQSLAWPDRRCEFEREIRIVRTTKMCFFVNTIPSFFIFFKMFAAKKSPAQQHIIFTWQPMSKAKLRKR